MRQIKMLAGWLRDLKAFRSMLWWGSWVHGMTAAGYANPKYYDGGGGRGREPEARMISTSSTYVTRMQTGGLLILAPFATLGPFRISVQAMQYVILDDVEMNGGGILYVPCQIQAGAYVVFTVKNPGEHDITLTVMGLPG